MVATQSRRRTKTLENRSYQQQMATTLVNDLGLAEALRWCQEYGWDGVVQVLLSRRDTTQGGA